MCLIWIYSLWNFMKRHDEFTFFSMFRRSHYFWVVASLLLSRIYFLTMYLSLFCSTLMVSQLLFINWEKQELFVQFHLYKPKGRASSCTELCHQLQQSKFRETVLLELSHPGVKGKPTSSEGWYCNIGTNLPVLMWINSKATPNNPNTSW